MECDLWEATAKGVSGAQLRRWTAQIVGFHPNSNPSIRTFFNSVADLFGPHFFFT